MAHYYIWGSVTRQSIIKNLENISTQLIGRTVSVSEAHETLSACIKQHYPVYISRRRSKIAQGCIAVGGYYYYESDKNGDESVCVVLHYGIGDKTVTFTPGLCHRLIRLIADTIIHEAIHLFQYRAREYGPKCIEQNRFFGTFRNAKHRYYGLDDEIEANAANLACEVFADGTALNDTGVYKTYVNLFGPDHPITRHVQKLVDSLGSLGGDLLTVDRIVSHCHNGA